MDDDTSQYASPEELARHRRGGENVLIHAMPDAGPHAGEAVVVVAERAQLDGAIKSILTLGGNRPHHLGVLTRSVRRALARPEEPHQDGDLMLDLTILFAHRLVAGGASEVLEGSGVATLALIIEPDGPGLTWRERGMLDPELERALNVPTTPGVVMF
ncbi:hypothetical protein GCM10009416_14400 [Craurococcus roseus]|uniref:Uncharacterized protein n=1 Tax=Craurococcus roseus TaxID=77585 RepID=A0ABP3Q091_9PROT